jgi:hypothetical protein
LPKAELRPTSAKRQPNNAVPWGGVVSTLSLVILAGAFAV